MPISRACVQLLGQDTGCCGAAVGGADCAGAGVAVGTRGALTTGRLSTPVTVISAAYTQPCPPVKLNRSQSPARLRASGVNVWPWVTLPTTG